MGRIDGGHDFRMQCLPAAVEFNRRFAAALFLVVLDKKSEHMTAIGMNRRSSDLRSGRHAATSFELFPLQHSRWYDRH